MPSVGHLECTLYGILWETGDAQDAGEQNVSTCSLSLTSAHLQTTDQILSQRCAKRLYIRFA